MGAWAFRSHKGARILDPQDPGAGEMKGRVWDIPARMIWGLVIVELRTPRAPCRWGPRVPLFLLRRFWATTAAWLPGYLGDRGACRMSLGVGISRNTAQLQNALLLGDENDGNP